MKRILSNLKAELESFNYSPDTARYYLSIANSFLDYADDKQQYDRQDITGFLGLYAPSSRSTCYQVLKKLFELKGIPWPFNRRPPTEEGIPKGGFTQEEVDAIFNKAKGNRLKYALVRTLAATGARRSEIANLDIENYNPPNLSIGMKKGEGGRTVTLDPDTVEALDHYLDNRSDSNPALFVLRGKHVTPAHISEVVRGLAKDCGMQGKGPHDFRRYLTTSLIKSNINPVIIQNWMGWKTLNMVAKYSRIAPSPVQETISQAHPLFNHS